MGYKVLGFAVWKGTKWYLRRRVSGKTAAAAAAAGLALTAGAAVAARQATSHQ